MQHTHETLGRLAERISHEIDYDKPVALDEVRAWLHAVQECETSAPTVLLQQWGALVKRLLEVERLGTVHGLQRQMQMHMHIHVNCNKASGWEDAANLFKEHHPVLAGLIETHLLLFPDGKPVEHLLEPWALLVAGKKVQPQEELSVSELVS